MKKRGSRVTLCGCGAIEGSDAAGPCPAPARICSRHLDDLLKASQPCRSLSTPTRGSEKDGYHQREFFSHGLEKALSKKQSYFHLHFPSIFKDSIFFEIG